MSETPQNPADDAPEGAIPTEVDSPEAPAADAPDPATMIGSEETHEVVTASGTVLSVADVEAQADAMIGEGEPLPVGAHDPSLPQPQPEPAGLPKPVDDTDRAIAAYVSALLNDTSDRYQFGEPIRGARVRPDQADATDAMLECIHDLAPRDPRAALVMLVQSATKDRREAALAWSRAVRQQGEERAAYEHAEKVIEEAIDALEAIGGLSERDLDANTVTGPVAKPVEHIVIH